MLAFLRRFIPPRIRVLFLARFGVASASREDWEGASEILCDIVAAASRQSLSEASVLGGVASSSPGKMFPAFLTKFVGAVFDGDGAGESESGTERRARGFSLGIYFEHISDDVEETIKA